MGKVQTTLTAAFERLHRIASDPGDTVAGTVRITASAVIGVEVLPPIMAGLKARHPALDIELDATDAVSDLLRHDADIAVRMVRPLQSTLIARRAATVPLGLFAHRLWLEATGGPASLAALLRDRQLIGYDRQPTLIEALAAQGVEAERRDFGFRSDSTLAQLAALRAGLGVGVCQVPLAARDPHLVRVLPGVAAELEIWVVSASELRTSSAVRACRELIVAGLEDYVQAGVA